MKTTEIPEPPVLTPADRKELKARAHHLKPVVMIGDAGLTEAVIAEAGRALAVHELIKIRVLGDDRELRNESMQRLCEALGCAPVQMIGKLLVVFRPRPPEPPAADRGPHIPKKLAGVGKTAPAPRKKTTGPRPTVSPTAPRRAPVAGRRPAATSDRQPGNQSAFEPTPASGWGSAGRSVATPRSPAGSGPAGKRAAGPRKAAPRTGATPRGRAAPAPRSGPRSGPRTKKA